MLRCFAAVFFTLTALGCGQVHSGGDAGAGGASDSTSSGAVDCSPFEDRTEGSHAVSIRVTNATSENIFLGPPPDWCGWSYFPLEVVGPDGPVLWEVTDSCGGDGLLCRRKYCPGGGCFGCLGSLGATWIPPGESYIHPWAGTFFREVLRPVSCGHAADIDVCTCFVEEAPLSVPYDFAITAYTAAPCADPAHCVGTGETRSVTVAWTGDPEVEVVFADP